MDMEEIIQQYSRNSLTTEKFRDPKSWPTLKNIILYHFDSDTRHEASFVNGSLGCPMPYVLMAAIVYDKDAVPVHEALEAIGKVTNDRDLPAVYSFLLSLIEHPEYFSSALSEQSVMQTARNSLKEIEERIKE